MNISYDNIQITVDRVVEYTETPILSDAGDYLFTLISIKVASS